jgi:hypothetical protein
MKPYRLVIGSLMLALASQMAFAAEKVVIVQGEKRVVAIEAAPGPYWYYQQPLPWGTYYTTVSERRDGGRCYYSWVQARNGWLIPRRRCEYRLP